MLQNARYLLLSPELLGVDICRGLRSQLGFCGIGLGSIILLPGFQRGELCVIRGELLVEFGESYLQVVELGSWLNSALLRLLGHWLRRRRHIRRDPRGQRVLR